MVELAPLEALHFTFVSHSLRGSYFQTNVASRIASLLLLKSLGGLGIVKILSFHRLSNSKVRESFGAKKQAMAKHRDIWTGLELYLEDLLWGEKLN